MSAPNSLPTERFAVVGQIVPASKAATTHATAAAPVSKFRRFCAIIQTGAYASGATLDAKLQRCTDASGTSPTDITGAAITQFTQAGTDTDKIAIINYDTQGEEGNAKNFIRLLVTVGTDAVLASALLLGVDPMQAPASNDDISAVDEIVSKP